MEKWRAKTGSTVPSQIWEPQEWTTAKLLKRLGSEKFKTDEVDYFAKV
jgi:hypothetical protein